jgi:hypothetical protein
VDCKCGAGRTRRKGSMHDYCQSEYWQEMRRTILRVLLCRMQSEVGNKPEKHRTQWLVLLPEGLCRVTFFGTGVASVRLSP